MQRSPSGALAVCLEDLYAVAETARPVFEAAITVALAKAEVDGSPTLAMAPLKGRARAAEKCAAKYGGRSAPAPAYLYDLVRGSVVCADEDAMIAVYSALLADDTIQVVRAKNRCHPPDALVGNEAARGAAPAFTGYRDFLVNVAVGVPGDPAIKHICELTIHHEDVAKCANQLKASTAYAFFRKYFSASDFQETAERLELLSALPVGECDTLDDLVTTVLTKRAKDAAHLEAVAALLDATGESGYATDVRRRVHSIAVEVSGGECRKSADSLKHLALALQKEGKFEEAEKHKRRSLALFERHLGGDHPEVAASLSSLGKILLDQSKLEESATCKRRSLEIRERELGPNHGDVAESLNNLGVVLGRLGGAFPEASGMLRRALKIREKNAGKHHADVGETCADLADLLRDRSLFDEADQLYRRAQAVFEASRGADDASVAELCERLARSYEAQGKFEKAEKVRRRAIKIQETAHGAQSGVVTEGLIAFAALMEVQGRYDAAECFLVRAVENRELEFGSADHLTVVDVVKKLAFVLRAQGKDARAEGLYMRILATLSESGGIGPTHPSCGITLNSLGAVAYSQGEYGRALGYWQKALAVFDALDHEHPAAANALTGLGTLDEAEAAYESAAANHGRALEINERQMGPDHPDVMMALNNVADVHRCLGDFEAAEPLLRRTLGTRQIILGPDHPDVASSLSSLAGCVKQSAASDDADALAEAKLMNTRIKQILDSQLGPGHPHVEALLGGLASLLKSQGKYDASEFLYRRAIAIKEKRLGKEHASVATSLDNLARLLVAHGRHAEAEPLFRRALAMRLKRVKPDNIIVAVQLDAICATLKKQQKYEAAEPLYRRAIAIREKRLGEDSKEAAASVNDLAQVLVCLGRGNEEYVHAEDPAPSEDEDEDSDY